MVSTVASIIASLLKPEFRSFDVIEYQVFQFLIFLIAVIILYVYAGKIADSITVICSRRKVSTNWNSVELLTILIIAISILSILSSIPLFVNQLNAVLTSLQRSTIDSFQPKQRFNMFLFGFIGAVLKILASSVLIWKAKLIAKYLLSQQGIVEKNRKRSAA